MRTLSAVEADKNKGLFFVFRLLVLLPIFLLAVFYWEKECRADDVQNNLLLSEVLPRGNSAAEEFLEIYNPTDADINLKSLPLKLHLVNSANSDSSKTLTFIHETVPAKGYFLISSKDYADNTTDTAVDATYSTVGNSLVADGAVYISTSGNKKENVLDFLGFGANAYFDKNAIKNPADKKSIERNDFEKNGWHESCVLGGTPGQKNSDEKDCASGDGDTDPDNDPDSDTSKKSYYVDQVKINEIYPAPLTAAGEKEFVEIENSSGQEIDFSKWCLKDKTENDKGEKGSCKKISSLDKNDNLDVFYGTFSLNNDSKGDTVFLYDASKALVDSRAYASPKSGHAYAFDGTAWRWTSLTTPGKENLFDKILHGKISKDDEMYKNIYAHFEVKAGRDAQKFTWDFGDGHKSYLQKTKHKYEKTGHYAASLKITGNGEDALYAFTVEVKKYVAPKIWIMKISPNPKGSDTENEWIEIQNNSKKKMNLKGWSVATGWDNLVNHPIREDFFIKADKTKKLSHDICAFTLTNAKDKLELRDPSGKAVQKIQYDHGKKSIQEETLYQKKEGSNWEWSEPATAEGASLASAENKQDAPPAIFTPAPTISAADLGKYSLDPAWQKKQNYQIELATFSSALEIPAAINNATPHVLGARIVIYDGNYYTFTSAIPQKHWVITFAETFWLKINSGINRVLNVI